MGLDSDEALVSARALADLTDQLMILEAALEDVEQALLGSPTDRDYRAAFSRLYEGATALRCGRLRARPLEPGPERGGLAG